MTVSIAPLPLPPENVSGRVVLERVSWSAYESLLALVGDRALRVTYDRGRMEIEMPSVEHERLKSFVGRLIETYALHAEMDVLPVGSATWRRQAAEGGLEADECYYVQHYSDVVGKDPIDLAVDPPPDLAVEVDLSSSSVDKKAVYARLGVPELWRLYDDRFECARLTPAGQYEPTSATLALPGLSLAWVQEALQARSTLGEAEATRQFLRRLKQTGEQQ